MKLSLRLRFFVAMVAVVLAIIGALSFTLWRFVEVLELELLDHTLVRELQEFADRYEHEPGMAAPAGADLRGYIERDGAPSDVPPELRVLAPGVHEDIWVGGREIFVGRKDVAGARLFLAMDIKPVEDLEEHLVGLALLLAIGALFLSALAAVVLARVVIRPVTQLAEAVARLSPQQRGVRVAHAIEQSGDPELDEIAGALDRYLERIDHYIEREQAFTEDASHELRTPLATMLSAAQLLGEQPGLTPQMAERLTRIRRAGAQMQSLIEALLFLAREDGGQAQDCALDEVVREAAETARAAVQDRGLVLELRAEPVTRRVVPGMAASVINNLLLNAVLHSGGHRVEVVLTQERLSVQDTGPGIPPEQLARIFERGYRGSQSAGLGLGLSLVKRICDRLGWTVQVSSAVGEGTRFTILLAGPAPTKN